MERKKIAMVTVGCRANQADSAALLRHLNSNVVDVVSRVENADFVIINTCCVTAEAERDCRKLTRRALAASEHTRVLLLGCAVNAFPDFSAGLAEVGGERIESFPEGKRDLRAVAGRIGQLFADAGEDAHSVGFTPHVLGRTRALLKIQNGCSHHCAYCIVPKARGPERSMTREAILEEMDRLKDEGFNEVVITGVQLGAWGTDLPGHPNLADMVQEMADRLSPGRVRISSMEPWSVSDELIAVVAEHDRICPHFHIPLQSGDDSILNSMGRDYTLVDYLNIVEKIKKSMPDAAIGTDILLGFPGEDSAAFKNSVKALALVQPAYVHAFPYSRRPGTRACNLPGQLHRTVAKERVRTVRALGDEWAARFRSGQIGTEREIIVEEHRNGEVRGLTDTFIAVALEGGPFQAGELVTGQLSPAVLGETRLRVRPNSNR